MTSAILSYIWHRVANWKTGMRTLEGLCKELGTVWEWLETKRKFKSNLNI